MASDKLWQIEVRSRPAGRDEPVNEFDGEEWASVRRPSGGVHKFETAFIANEAKARLERAQPHALFRVSMIDIGGRRRRRI